MPTSEEAYRQIIEVIAPQAIEFFKSKTADYNGGPAFLLLGAKGQFSDITRKWIKLHKAVWDGIPLEGEQPDEIVMDFIGHCLLMLYCLQEGI